MSDFPTSVLHHDIDREAWVTTMVRSMVELIEAERTPNPRIVAFLNTKHLLTLTCRPTDYSEQDWERCVIEMATAMTAVGATNFVLGLVRDVAYNQGTYPSVVVTEWSPSAALSQAMPYVQDPSTMAVEILDDGTSGNFVIDTTQTPIVNDEIWDGVMPVIKRMGFGNIAPDKYLQYLTSLGYSVQFTDGVTLENLNNNIAY
jgi:hypothetical protein